ncbi:hypothetical protein [uncultured Vagococcus sp.]|uniref:hypothetical protein n=1 Tax=uncultured Vagococcus sp. TaxID=189676 RepID=UPI0028D89FB7|nr:hypothetical protein [uncultured Vagococcus sp.]
MNFMGLVNSNIELIKLCFIAIGGIFAAYQYKKNTSLDRLKTTPIISITFAYEDFTNLNEKQVSEKFSEFYHFNFVDVFKKQHEDFYLYQTLEKLLKNVTSYRRIDLITTNNMPAYNTWLTFSENDLPARELFEKDSHYSINKKNKESGEYSAGGFCISDEEFQKLIGYRVYLTYQNTYREKFADEYIITENEKLKKVDSFRLKSHCFGLVHMKIKLRA